MVVAKTMAYPRGRSSTLGNVSCTLFVHFLYRSALACETSYTKRISSPASLLSSFGFYALSLGSKTTDVKLSGLEKVCLSILRAYVCLRLIRSFILGKIALTAEAVFFFLSLISFHFGSALLLWHRLLRSRVAI